MEFFKQEYWNSLQYPTLGGLPNAGIKPAFLVSPALAGEFFATEPPTNNSKICIKIMCEIAKETQM